MPIIKFDVNQKYLHSFSLDILRETFELYNTGPVNRTPRWQEEVEKFENPRLQFMQIRVAEFSMAFAQQLKKLVKNSPQVPLIKLTINHSEKLELTQGVKAEEIYNKLNF